MITKEDLKDWLNESARKDYARKLEEYIDKSIKANVLRGNTTFYISTGDYTQEGSRKTPFYDLWNAKDLSDENRIDIKETSVDCGWNNHYFALKFSDIDNVV